MLDKKYMFLNIEKYKVNYSQSKTTGQLFFDVSISASSLKELENESKDAIKICASICNDFNKDVTIDKNNKTSTKKSKKQKEDEDAKQS